MNNSSFASFRESSARRLEIWRPLIIVGVLLASVFFALNTPSGRMAYVLLASPFLAAIGLFLLRRPAAGVIAIVVGGLMVPLSLGTGTSTRLNPVVFLVPVVTALWFLDRGIRHRSLKLHHQPAVYFLLAFCICVGLSFLAGQLPWYEAHSAGLAPQLGGLAVFLLSAAAFLLSAHVLDEKWLRRLVYAFLAIGAFYVGTRLLPPLRPGQQLFETGAQGSVFWIWMVAMAAGMAVFHSDLPRGVRIGLALMTASLLFIAMTRASDWASGWGPAFVALLVLLWMRYPRWGWVVIFISSVALMSRFEPIWDLVTNEQSWLARRQAWQIVLDTVSVNPVLGLGPSNYYFYVQRATISGWGGQWNVSFSSHNNWVDLIAQTGILGVTVFLVFCFTMGRMGLQLWRRLPISFAKGYAAACVAGLVATLVSGMLGDWFLPFVYNIGLAGMRSSILFWIFLGGLLALNMQYKQGNPPEPSE